MWDWLINPVRPLDSVNPIKVWFHGFARLAVEIWRAPNTGAFWRVLFDPPGGTQAAPATTWKAGNS